MPEGIAQSKITAIYGDGIRLLEGALTVRRTYEGGALDRVVDYAVEGSLLVVAAALHHGRLSRKQGGAPLRPLCGGTRGESLLLCLKSRKLAHLGRIHYLALHFCERLHIFLELSLFSASFNDFSNKSRHFTPFFHKVCYI